MQILKKKFNILILVFFIISSNVYSNQAKDDLIIFAPASLMDSLNEVLKEYNKEKKIKVKAVYLGTAQLAQQIKTGASPDIFISANMEWMQYLNERKLVLDKYIYTLLSNSLVAVTSNENFRIKKKEYFSDIRSTFLNTKTRISLAMVDAVPAGIYAKEFFKKIKIWDTIKSNVANSPNVRGALSYVSRGDLEYGVVYKSDAVVDDRVKVIYHLNPDLHTKIEYPLSVLNDEENTMHLYFFLRSRKTSQIFKDWGFIVNND